MLDEVAVGIAVGRGELDLWLRGANGLGPPAGDVNPTKTVR